MSDSLGAFKQPQQGDEREWVSLRDQFGREWGCTWDFGKNAQAPVSVLQPIGWTDRLNTPPMYMRFQKRRTDRFEIDTAAWIADRERALEDYRERLMKEAIFMSPRDNGKALLGDDPFGEQGPSSISVALRAAIGPPPFSVVPIRALEAGNRFVLGLTDKMPKWAEPYFLPPKAERSEFPDAEDEDSSDEGIAAQSADGVLQPQAFPDADADDPILGTEDTPLSEFMAEPKAKRRR